jgi:hypothetical protein
MSDLRRCCHLGSSSLVVWDIETLSFGGVARSRRLARHQRHTPNAKRTDNPHHVVEQLPAGH